MRKRLESHLQIFDTGQQEARLHWILLKEFGHHPVSKGMWQDTCIIGQEGVWKHCVDMTFFISITMFSLHDLYDGGMRRQQKLLFLSLFLGEQGQIFSHTLHDVVGVEDGTIMVQRGYSLAFDDQEVLPLWEELLMCSSIMGDVLTICMSKNGAMSWQEPIFIGQQCYHLGAWN